jgi:hypothetical protein
MRKNLFISTVLLCALCGLVACSSLSNISNNQEDSVLKTTAEPNCFVQKTDGTIQYYSSIKLVTGMFTMPYLVADGTTKLNSSTIKAYQNKEHFAVLLAPSNAGPQSKVAKETLPGFAIRIAEGPLNIYSKKRFNGAVAVDEIFVQAGNEGSIQAYSPQLMQSLLSDHPEALSLLKSQKKISPLSKKFQNIVAVYNKGQLLSKN